MLQDVTSEMFVLELSKRESRPMQGSAVADGTEVI
jgi:hypothetical protein